MTVRNHACCPCLVSRSLLDALLGAAAREARCALSNSWLLAYHLRNHACAGVDTAWAQHERNRINVHLFVYLFLFSHELQRALSPRQGSPAGWLDIEDSEKSSQSSCPVCPPVCQAPNAVLVLSQSSWSPSRAAHASSSASCASTRLMRTSTCTPAACVKKGTRTEWCEYQSRTM
jgi:hypothetical protein